MELIGLHGFRQDGRHCDELRKINCKLGVLPQADGSAVFEVGNTKVMAAVYGPHEPSSVLRHKVPDDRALLNCVFSMATFSTTERKKRPTGDKRSQSFSINLKQAFDSVVFLGKDVLKFIFRFDFEFHFKFCSFPLLKGKNLQYKTAEV